jgi:hypothetical protein
LFIARQTRLRRQKRAVDVDRQHCFPFGVAEFFDGMHDLDTGVAH